MKKRKYISVRRDPWIRIWQKIDPCRTDGCWIWTGRLTQNGYSAFSGGGTKFYGHWLFVGQPLKGYHTDHVAAKGCHNRHCVNPDHLETVTPRENMMRGGHYAKWISKTHCPAGHPYAGENLRISVKGDRLCRTCARDRMRVVRARRKAALATQ